MTFSEWKRGSAPLSKPLTVTPAPRTSGNTGKSEAEGESKLEHLSDLEGVLKPLSPRWESLPDFSGHTDSDSRV